MFPRTAFLVFLAQFAALILATPLSISATEGAHGPVLITTALDVPDGERWLAEAECLSRSWRASEKRRAIGAFRKFLELSSKNQDADLESRASVRLGDLHRDLGLARESLVFYERALRANAARPSVSVDAQIGASRAAFRLDDFRGALRHAQRALESSRALGDPRLEVGALLALGIANYGSRDLVPALAHLQDALRLAETLGDERSRAEAQLHIGFARSDLGEEWRAIAAFQSALEISRIVGDRGLEALALVALGHTYSKIGEKQKALEHYQHAAPLLEAMGDPYESASLYTGMGFLYDELGDYENARELFRRALRLNEVVGSLYGQAGNLLHLGRVEAAMAEHGEALAHLRRSLSYLRRLGDKRMESAALGDIGFVSNALGREGGALDAYASALALARANGYEREEADVLNGVAGIDIGRGRLADARRGLHRALVLSRKTHSPYTESRVLFSLARVERRSGNLDAALSRTEEALKLVDTLRSRISSHRLRASYAASVHDLHALHVDLLMDLNRQRPGLGFEERAFLAAEKARARSLLDMLIEADARETGGVDRVLLEYERRLEERVRKEASASDRKASFEAATGEASSSLDELLAELDRVRAVLRNQHSPAWHLPPAPLVDVPELQRKLLDDRTAVLAYFLASPASYLWVITSSRVVVHPLPPKERIELEARELYTYLAGREGVAGETAKQRYERAQQLDRDYWRAASSLSETLLGDAVRGLEAARLVVIADGALHQIPFSALPYAGLNPLEAPVPLVARYEVVRLPSASTLKALDERRVARTIPRKKLAVLADPVLDARDPRLRESRRDGEDIALPSPIPLPEPGLASRPRILPASLVSPGPSMSRLLATRQEARSILELVPLSQRFQALGFDASRALVTSGELAGYEVVHFATHGVLNAEQPELSGIVLSLFDQKGRRQDGFLRLHDIYKLDLPVRLIVLSACGTGLGKAIRGEGLVGLVGGFLSTGSLGVIASYWDVDDEATAELMRRFYSHLFTRGLSPPSALQLAQRSMWQEKRWHSPAFWAAFEFQGDWR